MGVSLTLDAGLLGSTWEAAATGDVSFQRLNTAKRVKLHLVSARMVRRAVLEDLWISLLIRCDV